jgi:hypothetical protein
MTASFSASAYLVKTERGVGDPAKQASFANPRDPFDPEGAGYANNARGVATFAARTEKTAIASKRFVPPGDDRFFDGHH